MLGAHDAVTGTDSITGESLSCGKGYGYSRCGRPRSALLGTAGDAGAAGARAARASQGADKLANAADCAGPVRAVPQGYTRIYRAVSQAEYQDILKSGVLRPGRIRSKENGSLIRFREFIGTVKHFMALASIG